MTASAVATHPQGADADQLHRVSYTVTQLLSESHRAGDPVETVLRFLGIEFGFDVGCLWLTDDKALVLRCSSCWRRSTGEKFLQVSQARTFSIGEGSPGRAWQARAPIWLPELTDARVFPRASVAQLEGLSSVVAFPLYTFVGCLGVIEFLSIEPRQKDPGLMEFFAALGGQVGVFLDHARISAELRELDPKLTAMAEDEVIFTIDEHSTVVFANSALEKLLGYTPEELIGKSLCEVIPPRFRESHQRGLERYMRTGKRKLNWEGIALPAMHKNGTEIPMEIAFGEFMRLGQRVFTGFCRRTNPD